MSGDIENLLEYLKERLESVPNAGEVFACPISQYTKDSSCTRFANQNGSAQISVQFMPFERSGEAIMEKANFSVDVLISDKCGNRYGFFCDLSRLYALAIHKAFMPYGGDMVRTNGFILNGSVDIGFKEAVALDKDAIRAFNYSQISFQLKRILQRKDF